ncbi:MAG: hypothetical protein K1X53_09240 [Candidatus Sumerlaeaceae bacterium]|nr:hypothetical protein [Candidatus Sumerlaeaceae bacterium]
MSFCRRLFLLAIGISCCGAALAQSPKPIDMSAEPKWYEVVSTSGDTSASVEVRTADGTGVLGTVPAGYKFLAMGANSEFVAIAIGSTTGFLPASEAKELYSEPVQNVVWRSSGASLEDTAKKLKDARLAKRSSGPLYKPKATPTPTPVPAGGGPGGPEGGKGGDPAAAGARGKGYI